MLHRPDHPRAPSGNGYVFEHILVMEERLGRYLYADETIHHRNGVRDDNRMENLELVGQTSAGRHTSLRCFGVGPCREIFRRYAGDLEHLQQGSNRRT